MSSDLSMSVLTEIKSPFQAVKLIPMVHCSTTLRPTAMACPALLMMPRKSSTALFVPNKLNVDTISENVDVVSIYSYLTVDL